jgi:hypothetical protein
MKEIHPKYLPSRLPIWQTPIVFLLCDRFDAPGWVWGIAGTLLVITWIGAVIALCRCEWVKPSEIK